MKCPVCKSAVKAKHCLSFTCTWFICIKCVPVATVRAIVFDKNGRFFQDPRERSK